LISITALLGHTPSFLAKMNNGPDWCRDVTNELERFAREEMLGTLKNLLSEINNYEKQENK
jgi:hypothetical protein